MYSKSQYGNETFSIVKEEFMRNLIEYPVTEQEVIECLEEILQEINSKKMCGDTSGLIIQSIIDAAKSNPQWYEQTFGLATSKWMFAFKKDK